MFQPSTSVKNKPLSLTFLIVITHFSLHAQSAKNDIIEIFDLVFKTANFDSKFYRVEYHAKTFFVIKEGAILSFVDSTSHHNDLLHLKNGHQVAFNSKGWMFMTDVNHYLRFTQISMNVSECLIEIECIEFNGFKEKKMGSMKFAFLKEDNIWRISEAP